MHSFTSKSFLLTALSCLAACGGGSDSSSVASTSDAFGAALKTRTSSTATTQAATAQKDPLLATIEAAVAVPGSQIVVVGGSVGTAIKGARRYAELTDVPWSGLAAGTRVMVLPGSFAGPIAMTANGSAAAPIRVEPVDPAQVPVVRNSIDIRGASYLTVTGLQVQSPVWGGFVIRQGSRQITLDRNVVRNAPIGIDITEGAGLGLVISQNVIEDSTTHAINVATNATSAQRNAITGNTLRRSGHHGIELRGSFWRVERNDVSGSGRSIPGTSGIHVYSPGPDDNSGDDNIVRYNTSHANADTAASDGNGIQIDHWCDRNTVAFNLVWGNDGSGINIYEATDNLVYANTSLINNLDPNKTHGALGEIVIGASPSNNRTTRNRVFDNIAVSTRANVPAIYVDGRAYLNANQVGPNLPYNAAGGTVVRWSDSTFLKDVASIDAITGIRGNVVELPAFVDYTNPLQGGLRLTRAPGGRGTALSNEIDFGNASSQSGQVNFGAYFFAGQ
ncbi:right-handed parallel beta-helix repeat-containing protein [Variovorax sp. PvP013]|jgi:hypothetical protein|uniref:right-handed parallel beta-helix repeat-containing protein n=1 Tax=Variovorax sp. PvP013 TaxID=3156435 RepID=UPI003D1A238F